MWSCYRCTIQRSIISWSSSFFQCSDLTLVLLVPPSSPLLVDPSSVKVHGNGDVVHLARGIGRGPLSLLGVVLASLVIISIGSRIKGARSSVVLERVMGDAIPPSDDIIDHLSRSNCVYCSLFQVLVCRGRSSFHHFFQDIPWQAIKEELMGFWVSCQVICLMGQFLEL